MAVELTPRPEEADRFRRAGHWTDELVDSFVSALASDGPTASRTAIVDGEEVIDYAELDSRVNSLAAALAGLGIEKGDVVAWQLPNWWEAIVLHHGIIRIGAVSNPIIPIYRRREVEFILRQAQTKLFFHPAEFRGFDYGAMVAEMASEVPALKQTVTVRGERGSNLRFDDLLGAGEAPSVQRQATDPAILLYTSGTTADPKGVVHPHTTLVRENRGIAELYGLGPEDPIFMPSPLSHITGLLYGMQLPSILGSFVVLQDVWAAENGLELIERHQCSFMVAATPFLHGLTHSEEVEKRDLTSLRVFCCGGADVPPGLVREAEDRLGALVNRVYGSTEYPTAAQGWPEDPLSARAETDGRPVAGAELRIVDDEGGELPAGERGELLVRGPERFTGYLVPPADEQVFDAEGWFATGDMASIDTRGYLTISGRKKDIILRGGENISVKEVEDLLYAHPSIADVAIVAMPDPVMVERACAFVVPAAGAEPNLPELTTYLTDGGLAIQKVPERIELIAELPKNLAGKVQKFKLRARIRRLLEVENFSAG